MSLGRVKASAKNQSTTAAPCQAAVSARSLRMLQLLSLFVAGTPALTEHSSWSTKRREANRNTCISKEHNFPIALKEGLLLLHHTTGEGFAVVRGRSLTKNIPLLLLYIRSICLLNVVRLGGRWYINTPRFHSKTGLLSGLEGRLSTPRSALARIADYKPSSAVG